MKKIFLLAVVLMGLTLCAQAQDISKNALGLRLGSNDGFGAELSYQRALSKNNRLEADLGWRKSNDVGAMKLVGLYQWVWKIDKGFNWYAGVGAGVDSWSYRKYGYSDSGIGILAAGDIGIEYNFDFPLLISLDFRPEFGLISNNYLNNYGSDIALGLRYKFD